MISIEPDVDYFRLHLRTVQLPIPVLQQVPDTGATAPAAPSARVSRTSGDEVSVTGERAANENASDKGFHPVDHLRPFTSPVSRADAPATGRSTAPLLPESESGYRGDEKDIRSGKYGSGPPGEPAPLASITSAERADALHRALLSSFHARFPYETADTLEFVYLLVVTHHTASPLARHHLSAEAFSCLTSLGEGVWGERPYRTCASHLNALFASDGTVATSPVKSTANRTPAHPNHAVPLSFTCNTAAPAVSAEPSAGRSSIRVRGDDADSQPAREREQASETAVRAQNAGLPVPHLSDTMFLLVRDLEKAQQAVWYGMQRGDHTVLQNLPKKNLDDRVGGGGGSRVPTFSVLQGDFTHIVPASAESFGEERSAEQQRASERQTPHRGAGESATHRLPSPAYADAASPAPATGPPMSSRHVAAAAEARFLRLSVYRIPLSRFTHAEQQYYTDQREELRWRQRRRCRSSYRACRAQQRADGVTSCTAPIPAPVPRRQSKLSVSDDAGAIRVGKDVRTMQTSRSSSCSSSSSSDSDGCDAATDMDSPNEASNSRENGTGTSVRPCHTTADSVVEALLEGDGAAGWQAGKTDRGAALFFQKCHAVLTNYAIAHLPSAAGAACANDKMNGTASPMHASHPSLHSQFPVEGLGKSSNAQQTPRPYPGVSYMGVTRLLYSLAPCDCYRLVLRDSNPQYYAHSIRASYAPQTVPLSLVSDLSPETFGAAAPGNCAQAHQQGRSTGGGTSRWALMNAGLSLGTTSRAQQQSEPAPHSHLAPHVEDFTVSATALKEMLRHSESGNHEAEARPAKDALVRTSQPSRAPSPLRWGQTSTVWNQTTTPTPLRTSELVPPPCTSSPQTAIHPRKSRSTDGSSQTDGVLSLTISLICNGISGSGNAHQKTLSERGLRVPDFLLPDGTCDDVRVSSAPPTSSLSSHGDGTTKEVTNLFRLLARSSLAQHRLRFGAIRPVVSVAVLESAQLLCDDEGEGITATGEGARRCSPSEATKLQLSQSYCCRGLVDHTWLSIPVQRTPAEQEEIQWIPVMLGSTNEVSDVGLRTAVHLGVFPRCETSSATLGSSAVPSAQRSAASALARIRKDGVFPERHRAVSSLAPQASWSARMVGRRASHLISAVPSKEADRVVSTVSTPLNTRVVNISADRFRSPAAATSGSCSTGVGMKEPLPGQTRSDENPGAPGAKICCETRPPSAMTSLPQHGCSSGPNAAAVTSPALAQRQGDMGKAVRQTASVIFTSDPLGDRGCSDRRRGEALLFPKGGCDAAPTSSPLTQPTSPRPRDGAAPCRAHVTRSTTCDPREPCIFTATAPREDVKGIASPLFPSRQLSVKVASMQERQGGDTQACAAGLTGREEVSPQLFTDSEALGEATGWSLASPLHGAYPIPATVSARSPAAVFTYPNAGLLEVAGGLLQDRGDRSAEVATREYEITAAPSAAAPVTADGNEVSCALMAASAKDYRTWCNEGMTMGSNTSASSCAFRSNIATLESGREGCCGKRSLDSGRATDVLATVDVGGKATAEKEESTAAAVHRRTFTDEVYSVADAESNSQSGLPEVVPSASLHPYDLSTHPQWGGSRTCRSGLHSRITPQSLSSGVSSKDSDHATPTPQNRLPTFSTSTWSTTTTTAAGDVPQPMQQQRSSYHDGPIQRYSSSFTALSVAALPRRRSPLRPSLSLSGLSVSSTNSGSRSSMGPCPVNSVIKWQNFFDTPFNGTQTTRRTTPQRDPLAASGHDIEGCGVYRPDFSSQHHSTVRNATTSSPAKAKSCTPPLQQPLSPRPAFFSSGRNKLGPSTLGPPSLFAARSAFSALSGERAAAPTAAPPALRGVLHTPAGRSTLDGSRRSLRSPLSPFQSRCTGADGEPPRTATNGNRRGNFFIDEYDDSVATPFRWLSAGRDRTSSRVRPRGVTAMDAIWWRPTRELSSAPNLRDASARRIAVLDSLAGGFSQTSYDDAPSRFTRTPYSPQQPYNTAVLPTSSGTARDVDDDPDCDSSSFFDADLQDRGWSTQGPTATPQHLLDNALLSTRSHPTPTSPNPHNSFHYFNDAFPSAERTGRPSLLTVAPPQAGACLSLCRHQPRTLGLMACRRSLAVPYRRSTPLPSGDGRNVEGTQRYGTHDLYDRLASRSSALLGSTRRLAVRSDRLSTLERIKLHRHERERQQRMGLYQAALEDHYMCGPPPKRYCFERGGDSTEELHRPERDRSSSTNSWTWPQPRTSTMPSPTRDAQCCSSSPASLHGPRKSPAATPMLRRKGQWGRYRDAVSPSHFALPSAPGETLRDGNQENMRSRSVPCFSHTDVGALSTIGADRARQAEMHLRRRMEEEGHMKARRQLEGLLNDTSAGQFTIGANLSFTLRDIAAVFLRLPNTTVGASETSGGEAQQVTGTAGLEVVDICLAVRRTTGASCILARKPKRLHGGWESYLERINLYQEPFYLRDQAFVLLLPVPHVPSVKVCVAIHNVNDLLALVCQTPVARILPTAEEMWMRERQYGLDDADEKANAISAPPDRLAAQERRWCWSLSTSRCPVSASESHHAEKSPRACAEEDAAQRRERCWRLRRQHQADGLCLTWRHRWRLWLALFRAGLNCSVLSSCTSPLLTDPALCRTRCRMLCERVTAYATARHRLETLQAVRHTFQAAQAKEAARQHVPKPCNHSHFGDAPAIGLGGQRSGASYTEKTDRRSFSGMPRAFSHWESGADTWRCDAAHAKREVGPCAVAHAPLRSSTPWNGGTGHHQEEDLYGKDCVKGCDIHVKRGGVSLTLDATSPRQRRLRSRATAMWRAEEEEELLRRRGWPGDDSTVPGRCEETPLPPRPPLLRRFSHRAASSFTPARGSAAVPSLSPRMTRSMELRLAATRRVAAGDAPVNTLRHATYTTPPHGCCPNSPALGSTGPFGFDSLGHFTLPPAASYFVRRASSLMEPHWNHRSTTEEGGFTWRRTDMCDNATRKMKDPSAPASTGGHPYSGAVEPTAITRDDPMARTARMQPSISSCSSGFAPSSSTTSAYGLFAAPTSNAVAPYARSATLTSHGGSLFTATDASREGTRKSPSVPLSALSSLVRKEDGAATDASLTRASTAEDAITRTLDRLMEHGTVHVGPPLSTVLCLVPLSAQTARGMGAGVVDEVMTATCTDGNAAAASQPLDIPLYAGFVPTPLEVQRCNPEPFNISVAQMQQLLQWQWEHHQHCYTLTPEPLFLGAIQMAGREEATSSFSAPLPASISPLARELLVQLLKWSWLLPTGYEASRRHRRYRQAPSHSFTTLLQSCWGTSPSLLLLLLALLALVVLRHFACCLCVCMLGGAVYLLGKSLAVGLFIRLPSHRVDARRASMRGRRWRWPRWMSRRRRSDGAAGKWNLRTRWAPRLFAYHSKDFEKDLPPLYHRVSLLYSLEETTTLAVLERRQPYSASQAAVTHVLRLQSRVASLLSRVQLFLHGYSTALSLWTALLLFSYVLLYVLYVRGGQLWCTSVVAVVKPSADGLRCEDLIVLPDTQPNQPARFFHGRVAQLLRQVSRGNASTPFPTATASIRATPMPPTRASSLWPATWREFLEPVRYLLLQRLSAIVDDDKSASSSTLIDVFTHAVEAHLDEQAETAEQGAAPFAAGQLSSSSSNRGKEKEDIREAERAVVATEANDGPPPHRPSYFFQNGKYYAYVAEPPAWAVASARSGSSTATASSTMKEASDMGEESGLAPPPPSHSSASPPPKSTSGAFFTRPTRSSSPLSSRSTGFRQTLREWITHSLGSDRSLSPNVGYDTLAGSTSNNDASAATSPSSAAEEGNTSTPLHMCRSVSPSPLSLIDPSLPLFLIFAYVVTVCLPWSPYRWLWRRVWTTLIHDDALVRRPLLTV